MIEMTHGGDVYSEENALAADFSANINPLGLPQSVKQAFAAAIGDCDKYPDPLCRRLRRALSDYEGVPPEQIFCSNGASEVILRLALALRPAGVLVTAPTFSEYAQAAETVGARVTQFPLREEDGFTLNTHAFAAKLDGSAQLVFLCNPNNPTGIPIRRKGIDTLAKKCAQAGATLVVDECFMDFVTIGERLYSAKPLLKEHENLVILKAFTKIFAMPGARLGYCLTRNAALIERLYRCGQPWSVSVFAQAAGAAAAGEKEFVKKTRGYVAGERDFLKSGLLALGLTVYDAKANFLLFRARDRHDLDRRLLQKGFLIRSCANYHGLDAGFFRIAVRTHDENMALLKALEVSL